MYQIEENSRHLKIAVDAMGGDQAPGSVIEGIRICSEKHPFVRYELFGDENILMPMVESAGLSDMCSITHTSAVIKNQEKPSVAVRTGMKSSMYKAIEMVKHKKAEAVVSAGNTGALMALSKIMLRTLPGIHRPAIIAAWPSKKGRTLMLDLGANNECSSEHLVQFAIMGVVYARAVFGWHNPSIGLLNIGSEEIKGGDEIKQAAQILKESPLAPNFKGFVEGTDITAGTVDIVVTDGFTGNVALKTAEGTAKLITDKIKETAQSSIFMKVCLALASPILLKIKKQFDYRNYNGALFIGLDGISVKSHGSSDGLAFSTALSIAIELARADVGNKIKDELSLYDLL